jgi:hypothetical protein
MRRHTNDAHGHDRSRLEPHSTKLRSAGFLPSAMRGDRKCFYLYAGERHNHPISLVLTTFPSNACTSPTPIPVRRVSFV